MNRIVFKVMLILVAFLALGMLVLQERQRSLELRYQAAKIHREIQKAQSQLWRQQLEMAEYTSPKVIQSLEPATPSVDVSDVESSRE